MSAPGISAPIVPTTNLEATKSSVKSAIGKRVNGKSWRPAKTAFRPTKGQTSYEARKAADQQKAVVKAKEQEMKEEKEEARSRRIQAIKDKRKAKEEKERYAQMEEKMHRKLVERRKRKEKRNKLLKS